MPETDDFIQELAETMVTARPTTASTESASLTDDHAAAHPPIKRCMAALQHFNPGTVVEWKLERSPGIQEHIFRYVFWAFKLVIDGFVHCRSVISIDDTHVYGKYDIKLLIAVAVDTNGSIFRLAFAICANESQEIWTFILNHLKEHVVRQRSDFGVSLLVLLKTPNTSISLLLCSQKFRWPKHLKPFRKKEVASSSRPASGEDAAEPRPEKFVPVGCSTVSDSKVEKPSSIPGRYEPMSRYQCTITENILEKFKQECNWADKHMVKEKKRKDVPSSPVSEKKKPAKKSCKPKGAPGVMLPKSIRQLRYDPEEGGEELAAVRANVVIQQSSESTEVNKGTLAIIPEQEKAETILSRAEMVEGETEGRTSQATEDISRDELRIVDISGSPQILDDMIRESNMMEGRSYEGIREPINIHSFLDGLESAASKEASVLHHEAFLRIQEEHEAEIRDLTEKSDSYKLLNEKLRADLAAARDEHEEMAEQVFRILHDSEDELEISTDKSILQVRQRLEQIGRLNSQVDELMAEGEKFKENMNILASKKEVVQAQLESAEAQLRVAK
ncbi:uncharacterized protein [Nicotiana tomentosiformis]|uniref:uncharacterized protein n=1 Tax=Nicotiana tomentosiformis TaxID=4098 RepID=UPI00388CDBDF